MVFLNYSTTLRRPDVILKTGDILTIHLYSVIRSPTQIQIQFVHEIKTKWNVKIDSRLTNDDIIIYYVT